MVRMYESTDHEDEALEAFALAADNFYKVQKEAKRKHAKQRNVPGKVMTAISCLSEIHPKDLDECSIKALTQFQYWLQYHQGSIFVKTVGRLAQNNESIGDGS